MSKNKYKMSKIKCQMPKVNKVKLLSERTSGAPPVIFYCYCYPPVSYNAISSFHETAPTHLLFPLIGGFHHQHRNNFNILLSAVKKCQYGAY